MMRSGRFSREASEQVVSLLTLAVIVLLGSIPAEATFRDDSLFSFHNFRASSLYDSAGVTLSHRSYIHGAQYVDEHVLMRDHDGDGQDHYYLHQENFTVAGVAAMNGQIEEAYVYDAYGQASIYNWPLADVDRSTGVNIIDLSKIKSYYSAGPAPCVPVADVNMDGEVTTDDVDAAQAAINNGETADLSTRSSVGNPYFYTGRWTDTLHVDDELVANDGDFKRLQHNRARVYDPKHGRWLQRDPLGFVDAMNLYEYVGSNPASHVDPSGMYYKLWSTWENGSDVYWQEISPLSWWWSGEPSQNIKIGQYYYVDGQKYFAYPGPVYGETLDDVYEYAVPFDDFEAWAKRGFSQTAFDNYVFANGIPIDREGNELSRDYGRVLVQCLVDLENEESDRVDDAAGWTGTPALGARTMDMIVSGGVDPATGRNMTGREMRVHAVQVAELGVGMYGVAQWVYMSQMEAALAEAAQMRIAEPQVTKPGPQCCPTKKADATRFVDGVKVVDKKTGQVFEGTVDLRPTLDRIESGVSFPHKNDGGIFNNFPLKGKTTPELPVRPPGYYREYVNPTPGISGPGPQRIVTGQGGEIYYTPDHYTTFIPVKRGG